MDAAHGKAHQPAAGARGGNQATGGITGGNTKVHLAADAHGMPPRAIVTAGTGADCTQAGPLIEGMQARHLMADRGCDSDKVVEQARAQGMRAQIPPRNKRRHQREYGQHLYRHRHVVENALAQIRQWRGIATRCTKNVTSFVAVINILCFLIWLNIS